MMKKTIAAGTIALTLAGAGFALAQQTTQPSPAREGRGFRASAEDVAAFTDARVAGLKAGLKLTAEQEKNWPAVETAIRDLAKDRADRMKERAARREARRGGDSAQQSGPDAIARLRQGADETRRRVGAALQEPRRRPEAPLRHAAPHGRPRGRSGASLAAPRRQRPLRRDLVSGRGERVSFPTIAVREAAGPVPAAFSCPAGAASRRIFLAGERCWTAPRCFATARRLAGPARMVRRAHSSVGRAADS